MSIVKLFIPRILGNITISQMRKTFVDKDIGKVTYIQFHRRKNEHKHLYSFAFLNIKLFETATAEAFNNDIKENGVYQLFYDKKNYWEVKKHASKKDRDQTADEADAENDEIAALCDTLVTQPLLDPAYVELKKTMHLELLRKHEMTSMDRLFCYNCGNSYVDFISNVLWKTHAFCSGWCQYIVADPNMCKNVSRWKRHTMTDDVSSSKLIPMFQRIQAENDKELQNIKQLCRVLSRRPSAFTDKDNEAMEYEFDELAAEISVSNIYV